ncbi:hypothetical protein D3C73_618800 [compost metagenome]
MRTGDRIRVHHLHNISQYITGYDTDEDMNDFGEAAEEYCTNNGHAQCYQGEGDRFGIRRPVGSTFWSNQPRHAGCHRHQLQSDGRYDSAHNRRRKNHINPAGSGITDNQCDQDEDHASYNKSTQSKRISMLMITLMLFQHA